jgi:hypothetical protein
MKKQKHLVFLIIIGFLFASNVFAENENPNPPQPTLFGSQKPEVAPLDTAAAPPPTLVPQLIRQEIDKIKINQTNRVNSSNPTESPANNNGNQQLGTTTDKQLKMNQIKNKRAEQIRKHLRTISERFYALIQRELQIKSRIQSRLTKLEENGFNVSGSKELLAESDTEFETIKDKINLMRKEIYEIIESSDLEGLFQTVREKTQNLKKESQDAHTKLVQVVNKIKEEVSDRQQGINDIVDSKSQ